MLVLAVEWKWNGRRRRQRIARINIHLYFSMLSFYGGYSFSYHFFLLLSSRSSSLSCVRFPKVFWLFISYALMALNFVYESHIEDYNCVFFSNSFFVFCCFPCIPFYWHWVRLFSYGMLHPHMGSSAQMANIHKFTNPHICYFQIEDGEIESWIQNDKIKKITSVEWKM